MCPPSDNDRTPRNFYGYGANTLWFQYILCQQESIPSLACWLFTSGWNQADFGQYYFYDNLLSDDDVGTLGLDGDILPLLVLSGGLGAGAHGGSAFIGGHAMYRREVTDDMACPTGQVENINGVCVPAARRTRETTDCPSGKWENGECVGARKTRETTECPSGKWQNGECVGGRKRRGTSGSSDCPSEKWKNGECVGDRKRRKASGTKAEVGAAVAGELSGVIANALNDLTGSLFAHHYEDENIICMWNDWESRDQQARIQRTYNRCRFSRAKRTWGFVNGRWYCLYTQAACQGLGNALD